MHPFETRLADLLESGEEPGLIAFGAGALLEAAPVLGAGPFAPDFLRCALASLPKAVEEEAVIISEFVCCCFEAAHKDIAVMEAVDVLDASDVFPETARDRVFSRCLVLAKDVTLEPLARSAGLDGAFRWANAKSRRRFQLLDTLLGITHTDDPLFLARAAKIIGVAYSHWREDELLRLLRELFDVPGVGDEAAFELGIASLVQGMEAADRRAASDAFDTAKHWFVKAKHGREQRPDAALYSHCLEALTQFAGAEPVGKLDELATSIAEAVFQLDAWHAGPADPPWLGARHAERASWSVMALHLRNLAATADEPSWWEPAVVIERHLLACYSASRSLLRRSVDGGIEMLVQPRIEATVARRAGQAHALRTWLRLNARHRWASVAQRLLLKINLTGAGTADPRVNGEELAGIVGKELDQQDVPTDAKAAILAITRDAQRVHTASLTAVEEGVLCACIEAVRSHPDYQIHAGRFLFHSVLLGTLRFLHSRLELSQKDEPGLAYLFARDDGTRATEADLQRDYYQFMFAAWGGAKIEVMNVGGGRADVYFSYESERLVTEVKRDDRDCSFDAIERAYSAQASDYQNVGIRVGFLLVLDQTSKCGGTPHLSSLIKACQIVRQGEIVPRCIIIVKVPGQRFRPSDLTKNAKADFRKATKSSKRSKANGGR